MHLKLLSLTPKSISGTFVSHVSDTGNRSELDAKGIGAISFLT